MVPEAGHHLGTVDGVAFDEIKLRVGEPSRFIENLSWNAQLADIVNQRGSANRLNLSSGQTHPAGNAPRVTSHPIGMPSRISILGFQRSSQAPEELLLTARRPSGRVLTVGSHEAKQVDGARQPLLGAPAPQPSPDKQFAEQQISRSPAALPVRASNPRQSRRECHGEHKARPRPDRARRVQQPNHDDRHDRDKQSGDGNLRQVVRERLAGPVGNRATRRRSGSESAPEFASEVSWRIMGPIRGLSGTTRPNLSFPAINRALAPQRGDCGRVLDGRSCGPHACWSRAHARRGLLQHEC